MSLLHLNEHIPVDTPLGRGYAFLVESNQCDQYWTVVMHNNAIVTFRQEQIRFCRSYTHGRGIADEEMKEIIK